MTVLTPRPFLGVLKMYQPVKAMWVAALRSGFYPQTTSVLRLDDAYCALGVLCDVYRSVTGRGEWVAYPDGGCQAFVVEGSVECGEPPVAVAHWAGLVDESHGAWIDCNPVVDGKAISVWNDGEGLTFDQIADKIEAHL